MNFETPVIINAPNDIYGPDMLVDGENNILVDRENVDGIAAKIIHLLEDQELRERIGINGRKFVQTHLNWDLNAEKTEKLYLELQ